MKTPTDLSSYIRVLKLASTPSWEEFSQVAKIAGAGILLVGFIGFVIFLFMSFVPGGPGFEGAVGGV
jgi:protein transport protein SEC61 subunit gamma-like protein